ncbi:GDP-mannose transporter [Nematocida ausubeli]|nr:GDP-mannose transporter [Nematocida ausubeli]
MLAAGIAASVLNKYIVSHLHISGKFFILLVQTVFLLLLLSIIMAFVYSPSDSFKAASISTVSPWIFSAVSLSIMIYSGLEANARLSISLFTVLKNLTIPIIAVHDALFNSYKISMLTLLSFILIVVSSFLGAYSTDKKKKDSISALGITWMALNCFSSAAYVIRFNQLIRTTQTSSIVAAWAVNILAFPLILFCFAFEGMRDLKTVGVKEMLIIALSGIATCCIAVSNAHAAYTFSTTTIAVINALNKLPIAASGVVFGFETAGRSSKWISILLGVASSILYAASRMPSSNA